LSCGEKDRSNPLDPSNSVTHGSPPGFTAVALDGRVALRWDPLRLERLLGLNLYRREAGSQAFQLLQGSPLPAEAGATEDSGVTNGVTYEYRLIPLIQDYGEGVASPVRRATPGPEFAVVSDGCEGLLTKLSADMRAGVWTAGGFYYPVCVAAAGGRVWLADLYTGVYCLTEDGALLWQNSDSAFPARLAVSGDGLCAVVDAVAAGVTILSPDGVTRSVISDGLEKPSCVAFDAGGNLWLGDREGGSVRKYSPDGELLASFGGCAQPRFLDTDAVENAVWVGDSSTGELVKLDSQGTELLRLSLSGTMNAVEADRSAGGCWVADRENDAVARVARNGKVLFRIGKLGGPVALFASESGKTWVLGASEPRITVLSAQGELESVRAFGQCPTSIVVLGR
jgi:streptogramin lyase